MKHNAAERLQMLLRCVLCGWSLKDAEPIQMRSDTRGQLSRSVSSSSIATMRQVMSSSLLCALLAAWLGPSSPMLRYRVEVKVVTCILQAIRAPFAYQGISPGCRGVI
eukprot:5241197-Pleurochrysis_carterae.AAC.1